MNSFLQWVSSHGLTTLIIIGTIYAISYIIVHRKSLFYKK